MNNEVLGDLYFALLHLAFCWTVSGLLFALIFHPFIMGPYRYARFRYFNMPRKLFIWIRRSWRLIVFWPFELPRLQLFLSGDDKFCHDEDVLYKIPACRFVGHVEISHVGAVREYFYQIGDRYIRGAGKRFFFCKQEEVVAEMMGNPRWFNPQVIDHYIAPIKLSEGQPYIGRPTHDTGHY